MINKFINKSIKLGHRVELEQEISLIADQLLVV
jgi:hypothetical protein